MSESDPRIDRIRLLYQQSRYDLAEKELRELLAEHPDDHWTLTMLGLSLAGQHKDREAEPALRAAIAADPDFSFGHWALASFLWQRDRVKEALVPAQTAIELDPDDVDHHTLLSGIEMSLNNHSRALASADKALQLEPEHVVALIWRGHALIALNRVAEARMAFEQAIARDPDNAETQAALGTALLHAGESERAAAHFREALRIEPNNDSARDGFLEALKARHRLYRWFLAAALWLGRQRRGVQIGVIALIVIGRPVLRTLGREYPQLRPIVIPLAVVLGVILILSWVANPLFNLLMRFDPLGRHTLTPTQRAGSNYLVALVAVAVIVTIVLLALPRHPAVMFSLLATGLIFPLSLAPTYPDRPPRKWWIYIIALVSIALVATGLFVFARDSEAVKIAVLILCGCYIVGCLASFGLRPMESERETF